MTDGVGRNGSSLEACGRVPLLSPRGSRLLRPVGVGAIMASTCLALVSYLGMEHLSPLSPPSRGPSLASKRIPLLPCKSSVLREIKDFDHAVILREFRPTLVVIRSLITNLKISRLPPKYWRYLYSFLKRTIYIF